MIRAIAAIDDKRGISRSGGIPWNIPDDTAYYKNHTQNSVIIMGRTTYEGFSTPLPSRRNMVMSRTLTTVREGFELLPNTEHFLKTSEADIWIIGGQGPYETLLNDCEELYLTHVRGDFGCDRFFPDFTADFELVQESLLQKKNGYDFSYAIYRRIKNR